MDMIVDLANLPKPGIHEPVDLTTVCVEMTAKDIWSGVKTLCEQYPKNEAARNAMLTDMVWSDLAMTYDRLKWLLSAMDVDGRR